MTIASAIANKQQQVADCYTAISNKGGTLPATQDVGNMPTAINSISTGGTIDSLTITPTTSQQTITASGGTDGYSPITVNAVTSAIDVNIQASNIKSGVSILSVAGNVVELNGETRTEQLDSTSGNTYTPSTGKNAITSITVTPKNYARTVAPQTTQSVWAVPSGYSGHGNITVSPVTASIDPNIIASNIKSGVTILSVTGNYGGGGSKYGCTIDNLLGDVDANGVLQLPTSPSGDLVFTGVKDIVQYCLYYKFYRYNLTGKSVSFPDLETVTGQNALAYCFQQSNVTSVSFPKLVSVTQTNALMNCFSTNTTLTSVSMPELTTISGLQGCYFLFYNTGLVSVSLPKLTTISGNNGCQSMFQSCNNLETVSIPELTTVSGNYGLSQAFTGTKIATFNFPKLSTVTGNQAFQQIFRLCTYLTDVYFNALTTTSFGSYVNQFETMLNNTGTNVTHTLHFPSNLSATIAGLSGYPNFGGTNTVLAFDLPSTGV